MSKRRIENLSAPDELRWQAQERTLHMLRERTAPLPGDERIQVDDAAILEALSQWPAPILPAGFAATVAATSESLRERRRQVCWFRRAVFAGLALTYATMAGTGLSIFQASGLEAMALAMRHILHGAPWLSAALALAMIVATLGHSGARQGDAS